MRREKVAAPSVVPDIPHMQVVQEVQRIVLQGEADAQFFDNTYEQINDHADKLEKLKDAMHKQIGRIDQIFSDVTRVAADVVHNDRDLKKTLEQNDQEIKRIVQANDSELRDKLKALEAMVVEQGRRIAQAEAVSAPVGASTADASPVGARSVGTQEVQALKGEISTNGSRLQAVEGESRRSAQEFGRSNQPNSERGHPWADQ